MLKLLRRLYLYKRIEWCQAQVIIHHQCIGDSMAKIEVIEAALDVPDILGENQELSALLETVTKEVDEIQALELRKKDYYFRLR
jgi:hypothetical protein